MSEIVQITLLSRKVLVRNKRLLQLERPINMSFGLKAVQTSAWRQCPAPELPSE